MGTYETEGEASYILLNIDIFKPLWMCFYKCGEIISFAANIVNCATALQSGDFLWELQPRVKMLQSGKQTKNKTNLKT